MSSIDSIMPYVFTSISKSLRGKLIRNLGWHGLAEVVSRLSRIVATVIVMRSLTPGDLGLAATAITFYELMRVFSRNGTNQHIVQAPTETLDETCATAYWLNWVMCALMAVGQIIVACAVGLITGKHEIVLLISVLALSYVFMPPGLIQVALLMRKNYARPIALIATAQAIVDSILTVILALMDFGAWAIVLPKIMTAPVWLLGVRHFQSWTNSGTFSFALARQIIGATLPILATEVISTARVNLDNLLVGSILGFEALGLYYFAFNAGIGFSLSITTAFTNTLYPALIEAERATGKIIPEFDNAIKFAAAPLSALIACQALAAIVYVPIAFGQQWSHVAMLVSLLCASVITKPFFDAASLLLRANGCAHSEAYYTLVLTVTVLTGLAIALPSGLQNGVVMISILSFTLQGALAYHIRYHVLSTEMPTANN